MMPPTAATVISLIRRCISELYDNRPSLIAYLEMWLVPAPWLSLETTLGFTWMNNLPMPRPTWDRREYEVTS